MRTNRISSGLILLLSAVVANIVAAPCAGADEPLRWKFKVGENLTYNMAHKMWMTASSPTGKKAQISKITWNQYIKDCGPTAQNANEAHSAQIFNEKYKGKTIE